MNQPFLESIVQAFLRDLHKPGVVWQLLVIVGILGVCMLTHWLSAKYIKKRLSVITSTRDSVVSHSNAMPDGTLTESSDNLLGQPIQATQAHLVAQNDHNWLIAKYHLLLLCVAPLVGVLLSLSGFFIFDSFGLRNNGLKLSAALWGAFWVVRILIFSIRKMLPSGSLLHAFERIISFAVWGVVALYLTGSWDNVLDYTAQIVFPLGKYKISLLMIIQGLIAVMISLFIAVWLGAFLERRLIASPLVTTGLRVVLVRIFKVLLLLIAFLFGLSIAGLDLTIFSVFGGALGVGLGLGLQKIASNYFSGFILLFERSLRLGDMLTVDKYYGRVTEIRNRYIVLQALDGTETLIPNEMLVNNPVQNISFSNKNVRLAEKITVAYDTDLDKVIPLILEIAHQHPRVLKDPEAGVALIAFGDNGFELELGFWINDPEEGRNAVFSDINLQLWQMFKRENVRLPFPQRVLHINRAE